MDSSKVVSEMDMAQWNGQMEVSMKVLGAGEQQVVKASSTTQTETTMKETGLIIWQMAKEFIRMPMELCMKVNS